MTILAEKPGFKRNEILVAYNEEGDAVFVTDESDAFDRLAEDCGGYQCRIEKIVVWCPITDTEEASADVTITDTTPPIAIEAA